jgi:DNA invertase Pin-like site-specific DNA recombinase
MRQILSWKGKRFRSYQEKVKDPGYIEKRPYKSIEMRGQKYAATKLTLEKAVAVKSLKGSGKSQREVAEEFGIGRQMVGLIWSGKRWKEIG